MLPVLSSLEAPESLWAAFPNVITVSHNAPIFSITHMLFSPFCSGLKTYLCSTMLQDHLSSLASLYSPPCPTAKGGTNLSALFGDSVIFVIYYSEEGNYLSK